MNVRSTSLMAASVLLALVSSLVHAGEPDDLDQDLGVVRMHWQAGEVRAALSRAHLTVGEHPDSTEAVAWLALILDRVGQSQAALDTLRRAMNLHPQDRRLVAAMRQLQSDHDGCAVVLEAKGIDAGRFVPGRQAYALVAAHGGPRLVPGLLTRGRDDLHASFSASQAIKQPMIVVDAAARLVARGSDPQALEVAVPNMAPMPAARSMSAEELYERLLRNVVQDQPCD